MQSIRRSAVFINPDTQIQTNDMIYFFRTQSQSIIATEAGMLSSEDKSKLSWL